MLFILSFVSGGKHKPAWLSEGVAIYTSGQIAEKIKPASFNTFLDFYDVKSGVYAESGFAVELLVKRFGKHKILELIRNIRSTDNRESFDQLFEKVYGFQLTYEKANILANS